MAKPARVVPRFMETGQAPVAAAVTTPPDPDTDKGLFTSVYENRVIVLVIIITILLIGVVAYVFLRRDDKEAKPGKPGPGKQTTDPPAGGQQQAPPAPPNQQQTQQTQQTQLAQQTQQQVPQQPQQTPPGQQLAQQQAPPNQLHAQQPAQRQAGQPTGGNLMDILARSRATGASRHIVPAQPKASGKSIAEIMRLMEYEDPIETNDIGHGERRDEQDPVDPGVAHAVASATTV